MVSASSAVLSSGADPLASARAVLEREGSESTPAMRLLAEHGVPLPAGVGEDALATSLMDLYRRTGSDEVFEALVAQSRERLLRRVRSRTRFLGRRVDADELLQDALINIYRYPSHFDASRPAAFRAWSSRIVDNAIRRHFRRARGLDIWLRPLEVLAQEADQVGADPGVAAMQAEATEGAASAVRVLLCVYLAAYGKLSPRERYVLHMVEVKGLRYAQLAAVLGVRPEALKMVVFRARRRILARIHALLNLAEEERPLRRGAYGQA